MRTYERGLQLAGQSGVSLCCGERQICYVGMSELYREHDDLDAAEQHLLKSKELGEHAGCHKTRIAGGLRWLRIRQAQGDLDGALDLLNEAERLYVR